jgi:glycosyltransferase involved in cell wall biosynthesis
VNWNELSARLNATPDAPPAPRRLLRIAMVGAKGIPALHGGIERHVEEIATRLVQRGHRVDVFTRAYHPYRRPDFAGVRLQRRASLRTKHLDAATHTARCVLEAIASRRYDVVHVHGIGPGLFTGWAAPRLPTVFTFHAQDWRQEKWGRVARWCLRRGEATAVRRAGAVIVVSKLLQRYVYDTYGRMARYIPNGAALPPPLPADRLARLGLTPGRYILFVGRIIADRGVDTLLDAYRQVGGDVQLAVVGEVQLEPAQFERRRFAATLRARGVLRAPVARRGIAHRRARGHEPRAAGAGERHSGEPRGDRGGGGALRGG